MFKDSGKWNEPWARSRALRLKRSLKALESIAGYGPTQRRAPRCSIKKESVVCVCVWSVFIVELLFAAQALTICDREVGAQLMVLSCKSRRVLSSLETSTCGDIMFRKYVTGSATAPWKEFPRGQGGRCKTLRVAQKTGTQGSTDVLVSQHYDIIGDEEQESDN